MLWKGAGDTAFFGGLRRALGLAYSSANEQIADRLSEAMLDPRVAAALMRSATPQNTANAVSTLARMSLATGVGSNVDTHPTGAP